jgi:DNA polymerase I|tara:strand:- start:3441 stop:5684 length:2244 start_codon:yes stop_codon:yes gene_type:complete
MRAKVLITNADYSVRPVSDQPVVELTGRTESGESLTLYDENFYPYFYLARPREYDVRSLARAGAEIVGDKTLEFEGNDIPCAKIKAKTPYDIKRLRERLHRRGRQTFSSDILYPLRYIYDKDLSAYVEVEYDEHFHITDIIEAKPFSVDVRVLCFDVEGSLRTRDVYCICAQIDGIISTFTDANGESQMLEEFITFVREQDPDIITGYNIFGFDIPFLLEACERNDVRFELGRPGGVPWKRDDKKYRIPQWNLNGRILVDTWMEARIELKPIQETLEYVGQLLGLGGKSDIDASQIETEWKTRPKEVAEYCARDVELTLNIFNHPSVGALEKAKALSIATKLPLGSCFMPKTTQLVDSILIRRFDRLNIAVPQNRWGEKTDKITGAKVFKVYKPGIYTNVGIFDFKSMYPSIMIENNICPSTYTRLKYAFNDTIKSPIGARFRQNRKGVVPEALEELWEWRDNTKAQVKTRGDYYDRLQASIKLLMNSFYGVMASDFYRFTNKMIGGSITAFARHGIQDVYDRLNGRGFTVIYGDTDSVFVQLKDDTDAQKLAGEVDMELEKILETFFTHGAKKRYAATVKWPEKEFYVMGYELRRGDSFRAQRKALKGALVRILDNDPDAAFRYVSTIVKDIKEGRIKLADLVITKSVRKESDYVRPGSMAGVQAAKKLLARGYNWIPNTKVSWIVTDSKVTPMDVEPYVEDFCEDMVPDKYYYAKRLVTTLSDIAGVFEWDDIGLASGTKQEKLF